jgi:hypothetical protein
MVVNINASLSDNTVSLPIDLKEICWLPEELPYELVVNESSIVIGPIIAMVAFKDIKKMSYSRLDILRRHFVNYEQIKGLLFVCAANSIDPKVSTIEGYYYRPKESRFKTRWKYGRLPYPNAVYKRVPIESYRYHHLISKVGDRVINSFYFLKADIVREAEKDGKFNNYFPHTEMLKNEKQLKELIDRYKSVYIKPSNGSQGIGIYKVRLDKQARINLIDRSNKVRVINSSKVLNSLLEKWKKEEYIVQKTINQIHNNHNVDFRVYVQKNGLKKWVCQGMICRVAKKGTIVTNLKYIDKLLEGNDAIKKLFNVGFEKAKEIEEKIYDHCIGVCEEIDKKFGTYGDVAVDVIVDSNHQVWILEINKVYGYNSIRNMKNQKLLETLFSTPFDYAKALAGF